MKTVLKIGSISMVILAVLFILIGSNAEYWSFKYRQNTIRKEIKTKIKNGVEEKDLHEFELAALHQKDVKWIKSGKEFKLNGTLYDVVRVKIKKGKTYLQCVDDTQESKLFVELDELVNKRMNGDNDEEKKNLSKDYLKLNFEGENIIWISFREIESSVFHFSFFIFSFPPSSPPPRYS